MRTLADDIHTLCGPDIDQLYDFWKQSGAEGLRSECSARQEVSVIPQIKLLMPRPESLLVRLDHAIPAVNGVSVLKDAAVHQRVRRARSPFSSHNSQLAQRVQSVAASENAGRRVGAGAGATPEILALIRQGFPLSLTAARSRVAPAPAFLSLRIAMRSAWFLKSL